MQSGTVLKFKTKNVVKTDLYGITNGSFLKEYQYYYDDIVNNYHGLFNDQLVTKELNMNWNFAAIHQIMVSTGTYCVSDKLLKPLRVVR